jgi:predicted transcriptional regulator
MDLLISIHPEYIQKIRQGSKRYEYRKREVAKKIRYMVFYETAPVMQIVGYCRIAEILNGTASDIWNITGTEGGIKKESFMKYFSNGNTAFAYKLESPVFFENGLAPNLFIPDFTAPQSFRYLNEYVIDKIKGIKRT